MVYPQCFIETIKLLVVTAFPLSFFTQCDPSHVSGVSVEVLYYSQYEQGVILLIQISTSH